MRYESSGLIRDVVADGRRVQRKQVLKPMSVCPALGYFHLRKIFLLSDQGPQHIALLAGQRYAGIPGVVIQSLREHAHECL